MWPFKRKCAFCRNTEKGIDPLLQVVKYYEYGNTYYNYHHSCYMDALCNPEKHGHKAVDVAMEIEYCLSSERRQAEARLAEILKAQKRANCSK